MNIHLKIKECIDKKGAEIIVTNTLIGMLDDEQVFEDIESAPYKKILRNIIKEGYAQKLLDLGSYTPDVNFLASQYAQANLMQDGPVLYVLDCLAYGLGWMKKEPVFQAAPTQSQGNTKPSPAPSPAPAPTQAPPKKKGFFDSLLDFFRSSQTKSAKSTKAPTKTADEYYQDAQNAKSSGDIKAYHANLTKAANAGNVDAMFEMGEYYSSGQYTATDIDKAAKYFMKGAKKGHIACMNEMACYYFTKGEHNKALKYVEKPMLNGYLDSVAVKGMCLFNRGSQTEKEEDFIDAYTCLKVAYQQPQNAKNTHPLSKELLPYVKGFLGYCYCGAPGITQNLREGQRLLEEADREGAVGFSEFLRQMKSAGHFK